jgi:hypothetical protein
LGVCGGGGDCPKSNLCHGLPKVQASNAFGRCPSVFIACFSPLLSLHTCLSSPYLGRSLSHRLTHLSCFRSACYLSLSRAVRPLFLIPFNFACKFLLVHFIVALHSWTCGFATHSLTHSLTHSRSHKQSKEQQRSASNLVMRAQFDFRSRALPVTMHT